MDQGSADYGGDDNYFTTTRLDGLKILLDELNKIDSFIYYIYY